MVASGPTKDDRATVNDDPEPKRRHRECERERPPARVLAGDGNDQGAHERDHHQPDRIDEGAKPDATRRGECTNRALQGG